MIVRPQLFRGFDDQGRYTKMKSIFKFIALFSIGFIISTSASSVKAQYMYNYSSNMWVNSSMNLLFQKRWATARIRAAGKTELTDALEGRRSGANNNQSNSAERQTPLQTEENILRRVSLRETSFKSNPATIMPFVLGAALVDAKTEEAQTLIKA